MCSTLAEARAHVLGLLLGGKSPEEVEAMLEGTTECVLERTALTDQNNVMMVEVASDGATD